MNGWNRNYAWRMRRLSVSYLAEILPCNQFLAVVVNRSVVSIATEPKGSCVPATALVCSNAVLHWRTVGCQVQLLVQKGSRTCIICSERIEAFTYKGNTREKVYSNSVFLSVWCILSCQSTVFVHKKTCAHELADTAFFVSNWLKLNIFSNVLEIKFSLING